jgi:hypothetical protein
MLLNTLRRFKKGQDGNATIEFVIFFPALMGLFLMGFESGYYMLRNVMLERSVDISVRDVRFSNNSLPDFVALKQNICKNAHILADCEDTIQIELQPVATEPGAVATLGNATQCRDVTSKDDPLDATNYDIGQQNQMMLMRVCALSKPLFPSTRFSAGMVGDTQGNYAIVATAAFVTEPGTRSVKVPPASTGTGIGTGAGE